MGIGRPVTLFLNGTFADGRTLFVDPFWSMQDLVLACSRRMGFTVSKVFQSDGKSTGLHAALWAARVPCPIPTCPSSFPRMVAVIGLE